MSATANNGAALWTPTSDEVELPPVPKVEEPPPPERWCRGCKAYFTAPKGQSCPGGHANFMYRLRCRMITVETHSGLTENCLRAYEMPMLTFMTRSRYSKEKPPDKKNAPSSLAEKKVRERDALNPCCAKQLELLHATGDGPPPPRPAASAPDSPTCLTPRPRTSPKSSAGGS